MVLGIKDYSSGRTTNMTQMTFLPKTPADMVSEYAEVSQQEGTEVLYRELIEEEYSELEDEMLYMKLGEGDIPENELKEMADLIYVLYGYARVKGYNLDKAVERVHENNMGRMYQPDGTSLR
jgi:predicted HAD superfamily Cof-like phosphohydrolase